MVVFKINLKASYKSKRLQNEVNAIIIKKGLKSNSNSVFYFFVCLFGFPKCPKFTIVNWNHMILFKFHRVWSRYVFKEFATIVQRLNSVSYGRIPEQIWQIYSRNRETAYTFRKL